MSSTRALAAAAVLVTLAACGSQPPPPAQQAAPAQSAVPSPSVPPPAPSDLPPLPQVSFQAARPMPVVEAVFKFAAEHPEVLSHIPCFCGCEERGHRHNDDCFVAARDERGRVTAWEPHGIG
jgi:hypothetical protein